jgi:hypothetical protein
MSDNSYRNTKNEKFCSHLSTEFKRHVGFRSKRTFRLCLERELEWLNHARKYPRLAWAGWRPWISASCLFVVFKWRLYSDIFYLLSSALSTLLNVPFICFLNSCFVFMATFALLIRMTSPPQINRISEGLLYFWSRAEGVIHYRRWDNTGPSTFIFSNLFTA